MKPAQSASSRRTKTPWSVGLTAFEVDPSLPAERRGLSAPARRRARRGRHSGSTPEYGVVTSPNTAVPRSAPASRRAEAIGHPEAADVRVRVHSRPRSPHTKTVFGSRQERLRCIGLLTVLATARRDCA